MSISNPGETGGLGTTTTTTSGGGGGGGANPKEKEGGGGATASMPPGPAYLPPAGSIPIGLGFGESIGSVLRIASGNVTLTTGVPKNLPFIANNESNVFSVNPADTTILNVSGAFYAAEVIGWASFAASATGERRVIVALTDQYGNVLENPDVIRISPGVNKIFAASFYFAFINAGAAYLVIQCAQDSGADLQVNITATIKTI